MKNTPKITYCLWFNKEAEEAARFYTSVFKAEASPDTIYNTVDTPSGKEGTVLTVCFQVGDQEFMALNGGPECTLNPSISFLVNCPAPEEVEILWQKLSEGGTVRMPLDRYPFSEKYGWIEDKFGVSWQLMFVPGAVPQKIVPTLIFANALCGKTEEAIHYYLSVFKHAKTGTIARYSAGMEPDKEGNVMFADFMLENQWFAAMDSARPHRFSFNEAISFIVHCETQDEIDDYWENLSEGGKTLECGWLKDRYGVTWQVVPSVLPKLLQSQDKEKSKRVMQALMKMVKLDMQTLEKA